jgi:hypothetical protein
MEEVRTYRNVSVDSPPPVVVTQPPVEASTVVRQSRMRFSVAGVAALVMGVVLTLWSVIVLARAGFEDPLREPVVEVAGLSATAVLGLVAGGAGVALIIAGLTRSRPFLLFVTIAIGIGAAALLIEPDLRGPELMAEERFAVWTLIAACVVTALALLVPDLRRDHVVVDQEVV